ncbi:MAG: pseudouridine-5'-phosphate glycosidase [Dongiaceae bacterium]
MNEFLDITPEVRAALAEGRAVVALESTIVAHGMPYPQNLATARAVEAILRAGGAVPATIAILDGRLKVGLAAAELERLASAGDIAKASARDIAYLAATGGSGATTVAATMRIAALAGIRVFVTGGIGGVHRGAATSFDVSADLTELATSAVAVVSAGAKSILDIGATLETLETLSVPVVAYRADEFPAFYSRASGHKAPRRLDDVRDIARLMRATWSLGPSGGISIANPIPAEHEIPAATIERAIAAALQEMAARGIGGKEATPFLLTKVNEITGGVSLEANIALIENNARLGAEIAVAYARLMAGLRSQ